MRPSAPSPESMTWKAGRLLVSRSPAPIEWATTAAAST